MNDWQQERQRVVEELAASRGRETELKRLVTKLTEAAKASGNEQVSWAHALEGNRDGVWDWNALTSEVYYSPRWKEMLGYAEEEIGTDITEWDSRIHPDDRDAAYADLNAHLEGRTPYYENEHRLLCKDGTYKWILDRGRVLSWTEEEKPLRVVGTHTDVTVRKVAEIERNRLVQELKTALEQVKQLSGLLPICASCKKIRDDKGYWQQIETYLHEHSEAQFSHGLCPGCMQRLYPDITSLSD